MDMERNLVSTIEMCLQEHQVTIGQEDMYLVEFKIKSILHKDFMDTYSGELNEFKTKLAGKVFSHSKSKQSYGVLIDQDLRYRFAFNRKFADMDHEGKRIVFTNPEELLLGESKEIDLSREEGPEPFDPVYDGFPGGSMRIEYSLVGKKSGKKNKNIGSATFERQSLLDRVSDYFGEKVKIGGDEFFVITTSYKTSSVDDLIRTYGDEMDEFKQQLAEKIYPEERINKYDLIVSGDLQIVFAYNKEFGSMDRDTGIISYKPIEEVLLEKTGDKPVEKPLTSLPQRRRRGGSGWGGGGNMSITYSLKGKKQ